MCELQHRFRRAAERRRHARDDLDGQAGGANRLDFLAAAAEDEGIAALQPHNDRADLDVRDDQRVDRVLRHGVARALLRERDTVRRRSEEHTSELQSLNRLSYAVFSLTKKNKHTI